MPFLPAQPGRLRGVPKQLTARNENERITTGEPSVDRTIFVVISLVWMFVLSMLLGARINKLKRSVYMKRNIMSGQVLMLYLVVLSYIVVAVALVSGQGIWNYRLCVAGTWVCLLFYTSAKACIYTFLVERVHVVRAPYMRRRNDKIYLVCMAMVFVLYSAVSINSYVFAVHKMDASDGRCHFGIGAIAAVPVITVNIFTDIVLTGVFFYLLRPFVKVHGIATVSGIVGLSGSRGASQQDRNETAVQRNIRILLWKSIVGSFLIEIPTAANMIQFLVTKGEELGMICLTICMVDVCWDTLVIHWLTFGPSGEAQRDLSHSTQLSGKTPLTQCQKCGYRPAPQSVVEADNIPNVQLQVPISAVGQESKAHATDEMKNDAILRQPGTV